MNSRSAAEKLRRQSGGLSRGIITDAEFASASLGDLIDEPTHVPLPVLLALPKRHQELVVAAAVEFSKIDYYYPPPEGGSERSQREYQTQARIVCDSIIAHYTA